MQNACLLNAELEHARSSLVFEIRNILFSEPDKNKRFDWLISDPSKALLDRQKRALDRKIEGLHQ